MINSHERSRSGFTLVEVLVAIAVLGIVSVGMIGFFSTIVTTARTTDAEQSQTINVKSFLEAVAESWQSEAEFDAGTLPGAPAVPTGCAIAALTLSEGVRTLEVTCTDVDGPFVLALGKP